MAQGKRYRAAASTVEATKVYGLAEAIKLVKSNANAKFDETIEVAVNLGVDPKYADQMVRGMVTMPSGTGKNVRVAVFARDAKAEEAKEAGADFVGAEDLMEQVQGGMMDFDRVIASPDMMAIVGRLGKVLGPRGLMPNPKVGTVTPNVAQAVKDAKGGSVEFRVEKQHPCRHRQGELQRSRPGKEREGVHRCADESQAVRRQGHLSEEGRPVLDHGPGRPGRYRRGARLIAPLTDK